MSRNRYIIAMYVEFQISQPPNDASSCQNRVETVLISDTDSDESSSTDTCDSSDDSL